MSPRGRVGAVLLCALASCNQLLGIEESFVDPTLAVDGEAEGGERNAAATGGSVGQSFAGATTAGEAQAGGAAGSATSAGDDVCVQYCDSMREHCVGDARQYRDEAQCLRVCRAFPIGAIDDDRVNSASCRRRYAAKARYLAGPELATNCGYAGPGGDERCGSDCEGLCTIAMAACTPESSAPYFYESFDACLLDCKDLPKTRYEYGAISAGNSLECRLFHASSAIMADEDEHCEHTLGITLCSD